ncbi:MAG: SdrD B-like domain-containing protein [Planctomycetaceae bacterium]
MPVIPTLQTLFGFRKRNARSRKQRPASGVGAVEYLEQRSLLTLTGMSVTLSSTLQSPSTNNLEVPSGNVLTAVVSDTSETPEFSKFNAQYDVDLSASAIQMNYNPTNTSLVGTSHLIPANTYERYSFKLALTPNESLVGATVAASSVLKPTVSVSGSTVVVEIGPGQRVGTGFDAQINVSIQRTGSLITGRKFSDANQDGVRQSGEAWLNGWDIQLWDISDTPALIATTQTQDVDLNGDGQIAPSETGVYVFSDVPGGTYQVREAAQAGWQETLPANAQNQQAFLLDSTFDFNGSTDDFLNWGGLNERWFRGTNSSLSGSSATGAAGYWFFMTPDGSVYEWNSSPRTALTGALVGQVDASFYSDLERLFDVTEPRLYIVDVDAASPATFRSLDFGNVLNPPSFSASLNQTTNEATFSWPADPDVTYDIWISDIAAKKQFQFVPNLSGDRIPFTTTLPDRAYRVWMRSHARGVTSAWSASQDIEFFRPAVDLITGGTDTSIDETPTIEWRALAAATSYDIRVTTTDGDTVFRATQLTTLSQRIDQRLSQGETYRVAVRANFADGSRNDWGAGRTIRIAGRPAVTVSNTQVSWNAVPGATQYEIWVNRITIGGQLLQSKVLSDPQIDVLSYDLSALPFGHYSVWVRALRAETGDFYQSAWSPRVDVIV